MKKNNVITYIGVILTIALIALGTTVFANMNSHSVDPEHIVSNELEMQFNISTPKPSNNDRNPDPIIDNNPVNPPSTTEEITVVVDTGNGSEVSKAKIQRTTNANGTKKDTVTFETNQAKETVQKAKLSGQTTARILIPDPKDEVAQLDITIPKDATKELASGGLNLEIYTDNAKIMIPNESLQGLTDDFYFRVVPIKDETERTEVEDRARVEQVVKEVAGDNKVEVVARPMTIETNLSSRAVDIVLPLLGVTLPTNKQERDAFLADLVIFIEHSDGDRQLVKPEVVEYKDGQLGLEFRITKFSTFTILNMEGWEEYLLSLDATNHHEAYIKGYPDHTFRPERSISRAEMATILYRIEAGSTHKDGKVIAFPDVSLDYWAHTAIEYVSTKGLMRGFPDGTFKSDQAIGRAEIATIISRWLELQGNTDSTFADTLGHWAAKDIALVKEAGIIKGYPDGTYLPEKMLSRAEAVTIINQILNRGSQDWTSSTWSDVPNSHWALKDIAEASIPHIFKKDKNGSESIVK